MHLYFYHLYCSVDNTNPAIKHTHTHFTVTFLFLSFQAKSRTNVRGRAANGGSHEATSSLGTTGNTPVPSRSSVATANDVFPAPIIWHCT